MADDDDALEPNEIDLAIRRATETSPRLARARERIEGLVGAG